MKMTSFLFFGMLLTFNYVSAQFTEPLDALDGACDSIILDGADDTLGHAGKHVGFPALDGCYEVTVFQRSSDDLYYRSYNKYGVDVDEDGPQFLNGGDDSDFWLLTQYEIDGGFSTGRDPFMLGTVITKAVGEVVGDIELVSWSGVVTDDVGEHVLDSAGDLQFYTISPTELSVTCTTACTSSSPVPAPTSPVPAPTSPVPAPTPSVESSSSSSSSSSSVDSDVDSVDSVDSEDVDPGSFISNSGTKSVPTVVMGIIALGSVVLSII